MQATHLSLPLYPTAPGVCFQNPALRRYKAIKLIFPMFDQSNELTLGFLSERYVDARFWLNGKRYERVADFYDTWLVESLFILRCSIPADTVVGQAQAEGTTSLGATAEASY